MPTLPTLCFTGNVSPLAVTVLFNGQCSGSEIKTPKICLMFIEVWGPNTCAENLSVHMIEDNILLFHKKHHALKNSIQSLFRIQTKIISILVYGNVYPNRDRTLCL